MRPKNRVFLFFIDFLPGLVVVVGGIGAGVLLLGVKLKVLLI